jgi:vacuolar-type H+-ATPase subunit I/STV1
MPRGVSKDANHLREILEKGVILIGGEGSVDLNDDDPVFVGIIVNVTGYGPHVGAIYTMQNRFHGNPDEPLQEAHQILEEWEMDHNMDYFKELEKEHGDSASEVFTETFDGWSWELTPQELADAIEGTGAEKFIEVEEAEEEETVEEDDEDELEEDEDFDLESELEDAIVISDTRGGGYSVSFSGKHIGEFDDFDEALLEAYRRAEKDNYFPNFFYVNDHGNTDLLSVKPDMVRGKLVGVTSEIVKSWV